VPEIDAQNEPFCQLSDSIISTTFHNKKMKVVKCQIERRKWLGLPAHQKARKGVSQDWAVWLQPSQEPKERKNKWVNVKKKRLA